MKKNIWYRGLSLLAALAMLATSLPVSVFAQEILAENVPVISEDAEPAAVENEVVEETVGNTVPDEEPAPEEMTDVEETAVPLPEEAEKEAAPEMAEPENTDEPEAEEGAKEEAAEVQPQSVQVDVSAQQEVQADASAQQGVQTSEENFPDAAFRAWLLRPENLNGIGQDGVLTQEELQTVTAINVKNQGIASLQGIEYFTQLKNLNAGSNQLTSLTLKLPVLEGLYVAYNLLTTLDMSHNPKLEDSGFVGRNNDLRTLVLPNVPGLQVDTEDFLEQDPIVGSERSEWFYDSQYTQPIREKYIPGNGQTVYARRVANRYTVRFYANGGVGSMDPLNSEYGQQFQLPQAGFTRTGYHFAGWNTWPDGSSTAYANGQQVSNLGGAKMDGDKADLYAQWKANSYNIRYEAAGGQGDMQPTPAIYDTAVNLASCQFTKDGQLFAGWSTRPDGPVEYEDGQSVKNLTAENGATVTLYAVWMDQTMLELYQAYADYDKQEYIGEDWNAIESAYQEGQTAIEAAAGSSEKQTALVEAKARMAGIPKKEARVSEITDGWQTAFEPVFALAATQPAPEESAAAAKSAWQAVDMSWPEALVDYSSLKTQEGKNEAAGLAYPQIKPKAAELTNFARAMDWLNAASDLYALEPEQVTSDKADRLALVMEEYEQLAAQSSIQPAIAARLAGHQALAQTKKDAVAELESRYRALMENNYSQETLAQLDAILQAAKAQVESSADADAAQEIVLQGTEQMEQVKPEPKPTQTPNPTPAPTPTPEPHPETGIHPDSDPEAGGYPNARSDPEA